MLQTKTNGHKVFAVFDISSSSVAGANVLSQENDPKTKAIFLASARSDATLQEDIDIKRFVEETVKNLDSVIARLQKADVHKPTFLQVVLASPWYSSQTRSIFYKKENEEFTCNQALVDSLIKKEIDYVLKNEDGSFGKFGSESVIIERQISQLKLNGYNTNNPFGKKAETLEIFLTITIAPKLVLDRFSDSLKRAYGSRKIGFTTSPYTTFVVVRDYMDKSDECVIVDVGEEVTDVAFVKDGLFLYQHSFPVGTYALYRGVASNGSHTGAESKALLESYRMNKLTSGATENINKSIIEFKVQWQKGLQDILDNGNYGFCMPEHCFVTSDPRFEIIFTDIIKTDPYIQHTCSRGIVTPFFVETAVIGEKVKTLDNTNIDTPLAVAALFVQRLL